MIKIDLPGQFIATAVDIFVQNPAADEAELVEKIRARVGEEDLAERLVEFVPLAFGRVLLKRWGVSVPDCFTRMISDNEFSEQCPLAAEPIWNPVLTYAKEAHSRMPKEQFWSIAARSAEANAVAKAVEAGSNPWDLVGAPPIFTRSAPLPQLPPKQWWQIWK